MQQVILFTILLGWSSLGAQPINMAKEYKSSSTISAELHMDKVVISNDISINQSTGMPAITTTTPINRFQISTTKKIDLDHLWMDQSTSKPIIPPTEPKQRLNKELGMIPRKVEIIEATKSIISSPKTKTNLLKTSTEDTKNLNNLDDSEPRPTAIGTRLSAKLLKVLTLLG